MKYVMMTDASGMKFPIVFDDRMPHIIMAAAGKASGMAGACGAGFVRRRENGTIECYGNSESLDGLGPGDEDEEVLTLFMDRGLSGLEIGNRRMAIAMGMEIPEQWRL